MDISTSSVTRPKIDKKRAAFIILGLIVFAIVYFSPAWPAAIDPNGKSFALTKQGKASLALFLLACIWWIFEVIPIGVTSIAIGVTQALLLIRDAQKSFTDFMDPSVWFIFASLVIGLTFTKTGVTQRMAYKMLLLVGERASMIYLGVFIMVGCLTLVMAHTAVAATVFPLLMAINALYSEDDKPTRFGKGLFIGMAFSAGAASIITLLGAARGAVGIGFFKEFTGREISFFEFSYYMFPVGMVMIGITWLFLMLWYPPEKKVLPGLRERAKALYVQLGPVTLREVLAVIIVLTAVVLLGLRSIIPALKPIDKTSLILITTILFFLLNILDVNDLEKISWNIILLFGGSMSMGYCLWQTGAAQWLAINWLMLFKSAPGFVFVMSIAVFVLIMTNFIMNVTAIAISLPVALVIAPYLHLTPEVIFFTCLVAAGMPFVLLIGAAPNAIAYSSRQFTPKEFLMAGIPMSVILLIVLGIFIRLVWPLMGLPVGTK